VPLSPPLYSAKQSSMHDILAAGETIRNGQNTSSPRRRPLLVRGLDHIPSGSNSPRNVGFPLIYAGDGRLILSRRRDRAGPRPRRRSWPVRPLGPFARRRRPGARGGVAPSTYGADGSCQVCELRHVGRSGKPVRAEPVEALPFFLSDNRTALRRAQGERSGLRLPAGLRPRGGGRRYRRARRGPGAGPRRSRGRSCPRRCRRGIPGPGGCR